MKESEILLDAHLCFDSSLLSSKKIDSLQNLLSKRLPNYAQRLLIHREGLPGVPVNSESSLHQVVREIVSERGETYYALVDRYGGDTREFGLAELRGSNDSLVIFIRFDAHVFSPSSGRWLWGNTISIKSMDFRFEQLDGVDSFRRLFEMAVSELNPIYARANLEKEYERKNIDTSNGFMAVGVDVSRYLPGLYWGNYFGKKYSELMQLDNLEKSATTDLKRFSEGYLCYLSESPFEENTSAYLENEKRVEQLVGPEFFFSKQRENGLTRSPDFELPELPKHPRFS